LNSFFVALLLDDLQQEKDEGAGGEFG